VITADHMVDVVAGKTVDKPVIVITDGRISAVGAQGTVAVPADARHIDLPGQTILPGLIDMHVHLNGDPTIGGFRGLGYTDSF
ncbi:amidohydrolase family protein, partial [Salmonella enterica]